MQVIFLEEIPADFAIANQASTRPPPRHLLCGDMSQFTGMATHTRSIEETGGEIDQGRPRQGLK
jgi:hypothetical protein